MKKDSRPFFSIIMPTRNRAQLLTYALQSALAQTFDDYEIVVSDNQSDDHTEEVVRAFTSGRIRYVRTPRILPMYDSWEFAIGHATGEYVTFLCDDDAMLPELLETVNGAIEGHEPRVVSWNDLIYKDRPWGDQLRNNQVIITPFTGRVQVRESKAELRKLFQLEDRIGIPKMLNSCCHRAVLEQVQGRCGRFFFPVAPDYSSCALSLAVTQQYTFIDTPLMVTGLVSVSKSQAVIRQFEKEFGGEQLFMNVPLSAVIGRNGIAETLLRVKRAMPEGFVGLEMDWARYFLRYARELRDFEEHGIEVGATWEEFHRVFSNQSLGLRSRLELIRANSILKSVAKSSLHSILRHSGLIDRWKANLKGQRIGTTLVIEGQTVGVRNILDCCKAWPMLLGQTVGCMDSSRGVSGNR